MTEDDIRDAWTKAGGDFLSGNGGRELAEAWINELRAFARAIAAAEREACASIVLGWREADWPEGFDRRTAELLAEDRAAAIRARSET